MDEAQLWFDSNNIRDLIYDKIITALHNSNDYDGIITIDISELFSDQFGHIQLQMMYIITKYIREYPEVKSIQHSSTYIIDIEFIDCKKDNQCCNLL